MSTKQKTTVCTTTPNLSLVKRDKVDLKKVEIKNWPLPCEHQHFGYRRLQKVQVKMMTTEPSIRLERAGRQAE